MKRSAIFRTIATYCFLLVSFTLLLGFTDHPYWDGLISRLDVSILLVVFVAYLQNAMKHYALMGYKPTFWVAVCDPVRQSILMVQYRKGTGGFLKYLKFLQGGDIGENAYSGIKEALDHRLGITMEKFKYTVCETIPLGVSRSKDYITKVSTDRFSLFPYWIGKGFLLSIVSMDLSEENMKKLKADPRNIGDICAIPLSQLLFHLEEASKDRGSDASPELYDKACEHIQAYMKRMERKYADLRIAAKPPQGGKPSPAATRIQATAGGSNTHTKSLVPLTQLGEYFYQAAAETRHDSKATCQFYLKLCHEVEAFEKHRSSSEKK